MMPSYFPPPQVTSASPHTPPTGFHQPNDNLPPETSPKRRSSVSDLLQTYSINTLYPGIQNIMKPLPTQGYIDLYFTTATIKGWKPLLKPDKYKDIVTDSMAFLAARQEVCFYAFVIMPNHIHWIWQMLGETDRSSVQQRMLKYIAGQIRVDLQTHHPLVLEEFKSERKDRSHQFFKDRPLSIALLSDKVVLQKMRYIHQNPVQQKWKLADKAEDYVYSSASLYTQGVKRWPFLRHFWYDVD